MVIHVSYNGKTFPLKEGETVLDCLLREGQGVAYSCRAGVCHSCIMKMPSGTIPPEAQEGLKPALKQQGFFLACQCHPVSDSEVIQAEPENDFSYIGSDKDSLLLLVGVGAGLAPLYKIASSATDQKHRGKIILYHVVKSNDDLYMVSEMKELANERYSNFLLYDHACWLSEESLPRKIICGAWMRIKTAR
jgi:ferredoxin